MSAEHGSPADRGSADAYYWRGKFPHKRVNGEEITDLTPAEAAEYDAAYDAEQDRKDYGRDE